MNRKLIVNIIEKKLESILSIEASRGIHDKELLRFLFKYEVMLNGLLLEIPIEEFDGSIGVMKDNDEKCKVIDKNKYDLIINNIQKIIIELFQKINIKILLEYKGCYEKLKINQLSDNIYELVASIKVNITDIEIFSNNVIKNNEMFILKDGLSNKYYAGENSKYIWDYKKTKVKTFIDLDELALDIIRNNFTNIKLIKYTIKDIENALNEEADKEIVNKINLDIKDIDWFNSFDYSYWMNMAHISAQNNWLTGKEKGFLMQMGKYKKDAREPSSKQINWLKKIYEKYNNLNT
jgi:hypothetical protein